MENGLFLFEVRFPGLPLQLWKSSWDLVFLCGSWNLHAATVQLKVFITCLIGLLDKAVYKTREVLQSNPLNAAAFPCDP